MGRKKRKPKMEFRYYQLPAESPILALLGDKWVQEYGEDADWLHFHNYMEIGFCYYGGGELVLGDEQYRFKGGQFTVITRNFPHTTESDPGTISRWEYLFLDMEEFLRGFSISSARTERMIRRILASGGNLYSEEEYPELAAKIRGIMDIMRKAEAFYLEEASGILYSVLAEVARISSGGDEEPLEADNVRTVNMVARVLDYISEHYMEQIRVEELAKFCHISESHFRRVFSAHMKMGPLEYINIVRIRAACEHLKKTDESVADIAYKCGFVTNSTFNRNFRQIMGVSPMQWRAKPENYEQRLLKYEIHSEEGW